MFKKLYYFKFLIKKRKVIMNMKKSKRILSAIIAVMMTVSGCWLSAAASGNETNLPDYSFDESKIASSVINGGEVERSEEFTRGVGASFYYYNENYNGQNDQYIFNSEWAQDYLDELQINSLRFWGSPNNGNLNSLQSKNRTGMFTSVAVDYEKSTSNNNSNVEVGIKFSQTTENAFKAIKERLSGLTTFAGIKGHLLGNEYTNHVYTNSTHHYGGYDDYTQTQFKTVWLAERFGTIENLKAKLGYTGNDWATWTDVPAVVQWNGASWQKKLWLEFYQYQQTQFENLMRSAYEMEKSDYPNISVGYAKSVDDNGPYSDDADLSFLDFGGQNLYYTPSLDENDDYTPGFDNFSYAMQNQVSLYGNKPFFATETGLQNNVQNSVTQYKQLLSMLYMHPQIAGAYAYTFSSPDGDWSLVNQNKVANSNFYAVKKAYADFKYLDNFFVGSSESPIAAYTNGKLDKLIGSISAKTINSVLSAHGVSTKAIQSDNANQIANLGVKKLILADKILNQNPDGSDDTAAALNTYASSKKVISLQNNDLNTLYGSNTGLNNLKANSNYTAKNTDIDDQTEIWNDLAEFLHGDFVAGEVELEENTIDSNAVRVIDTTATDISNLEQTLLYKNGHLYLCLVNTSVNSNDVTVTIGVNDGVAINFRPRILAADGSVSVSKPVNAIAPSWTDETEIRYGTLNVSNLDSYVYIDLGMAVPEDMASGVSPASETDYRMLFSFEEDPMNLSDYVKTEYGTTVEYSYEYAENGSASLKAVSTDCKYPSVTIKSDVYSDFCGDGLSAWVKGNLSSITLNNANGDAICRIPVTVSDISGETVAIDYQTLGLSSQEILNISSVTFTYQCGSTSNTVYVDAIKVINPDALIIPETQAVRSIEVNDSTMRTQFLERTVNISSEETGEGIMFSSASDVYPAFELKFGYYCDSVSVTMNNSGEDSFTIATYTVTYMDGTTTVSNVYSSLASEASRTFTVSNLAGKGIALLTFVFRKTGEDVVLTVDNITVNNIRSERVVAAGKKIEQMSPFSYEKVRRYYESLSAQEKAYVYNANTLNRYLPTVDGTSICMEDNEYNGQMAFHIVNPTLTATLQTEGYEITKIGVAVLPTQLVSGKLTKETANAENVTLTFGENADKSEYASYSAILKNSTKYPFVNMSASAFVEYSDDNHTVILYSDGTFIRSLNTTYRLTANEYLKTYQNEQFTSTVDFTKAYSFKTVYAFVKEAFDSLN